MITRNIVNKIFNTNRKSCCIQLPIILSLILVVCVQQIEAGSVMLLPLTASKVYEVLRQSDYLDAVPEGRVVTQGIAAVAGFTLGLKKALGAVFLYDIITANITEDTTQTSDTPVYLTQEVCFSSRNARSLDEAEAIAEAYSRLEEKDTQLQAAVRQSQVKRRFKPKRNKKRKSKNKQRNKRAQRIKVLRPTTPALTKNLTNTGILIAHPSTTTVTAGTQTTQPARSNVAAGTGGETNVDAGTGLETTSSTTTGTDNPNNSVTCIVIQKPKP